MKKRMYLISIALSVILIGMLGCGKKEEEVKSRTELFMGTAISVKIYNGKEEVLNEAFEKVKEIEDKVSINKNETEVYEINKNAGIKKVSVSDDTFEIIEKGLKYSEMSNGKYDISIGPIVKLWSIGLPEAKIPTQEEVNKTLEYVDYRDIELNKETKEVFLKEKGMILDLGSIAKGYAADQIAEILKEQKIEKAIIDLGGNIYAMGTKEKDKPWKIGIQNPFSERGDVVGSVYVENKSVVTTGIYERFIEEEGKKYHHILDPKKGYPYESNIAGVSIISDKSIDGDALSTLIFTLGIDEGLKFINELNGVESVFVDNNKNIYLSDGLENNFELINKDFKKE
ncbi:FAD:protein FMN transferase [uncultured Clostridium sp.]|uniref:FAD:protein FMN transferase n=1 Tax=uncultured Clostridium sp. TaxID=59620 RepID=UPI002634AB72|nr:FAD:protein FMN transferase [uncultured Clostridium sp.]